MIILDYPSKKALKEQAGCPLRYIETSAFGPEYRENGTLTGTNRPRVTGCSKRFSASTAGTVSPRSWRSARSIAA